MSYIYNPNYYDGTNLKMMRPPGNVAFKTYILSNGIILGLFQGNRGQRKDIDYILKILKPGVTERPIVPIHSFWVVDLMLKIEDYKDEVREIVNYYRDFYDKAVPFETIEERNTYQPKTVDYIITKYKHIDKKNTLPIDYIAYVLELFILCEKRSNPDAWMFKRILDTFLFYIDGEADYMELISGISTRW